MRRRGSVFSRVCAALVIAAAAWVGSPAAAGAQSLQRAGDGASARPLEPFCVGLNGLGCRTTLAIDVGLGPALAIHDGAADVAIRGFTALGLRSRVARVWRLGPMVDVGFEVAGNQELDKALGWFVVPKVSALRALDEEWALAFAAGPSFVRSSHDLGTDQRFGAFGEAGIALGEATVTLATEPLFDPSGGRGAELRTYLLVRASICGWASAMSYGQVDC